MIKEKQLTEEQLKHIELHRVEWEMVDGRHPNFNIWRCYKQNGEFLYDESFPKRINPNNTYPCGQHTINGLVPEQFRDVAYTTAPVEREGFRHERKEEEE